MKPLLLAIFFLVVIITGSLMTMNYISDQADTLLNQLLQIEKQVDSENWEHALALYRDFKTKWSKVDHKWSMLIDHYEIDYINMDLGELEAFIKTKDRSSALAKISSLQLLVKHIPEKEYPTLKNIL